MLGFRILGVLSDIFLFFHEVRVRWVEGMLPPPNNKLLISRMLALARTWPDNA
jgi:hypothetical protein